MTRARRPTSRSARVAADLSARQRSRCGVRDGFTLIEMLLVLAVIVVLASLTLPAMARWQRGDEVNRAAVELRDELLRQRVLAIRDAATVTFTRVPGGRQYDLTVTDSLGAVLQTRSGRLPEQVRFAAEEPTAPVVFRADGTAVDAVIVLSDLHGDRATVTIDRLTGSVRSRDGGHL